MIAGKMHDLQSRQIPLSNVLLEFVRPHIRANLIRDLHVKGRVIGAGVGIERALKRVIANGRILVLARKRFSKLSIVTQRQPLPDSRIPKISRRGFVYVTSVVWVTAR